MSCVNVNMSIRPIRIFGPGILEELGRHVTFSKLYFRDYDEWEMSVSNPYLYRNFNDPTPPPPSRLFEMYKSMDIEKSKRNYDTFVLNVTNAFRNRTFTRNNIVGGSDIEWWVDTYSVSRGIAIMMMRLVFGRPVISCFIVDGIFEEDLIFAMYKRGILD